MGELARWPTRTAPACTDSSSGTGYSHRGNRPTAANKRSVPYRVGELVTELAEAGVPAAAPGPTTPGLTGAVGVPEAAPAGRAGTTPGAGDGEQRAR